jgi:hypothetical protein
MQKNNTAERVILEVKNIDSKQILRDEDLDLFAFRTCSADVLQSQ